MNTTPNYELLKDAYAIIGGIPARKFNLDDIQVAKGKSLSCGTICCAAGWLGHHPKFQALGLKTEEYGSPVNNLGAGITFNGTPTSFAAALASIFNMSHDDALQLFSSRGNGGFNCDDRTQSLTHKQVWQKRVRSYLRDRGQLKSQLNKHA